MQYSNIAIRLLLTYDQRYIASSDELWKWRASCLTHQLIQPKQKNSEWGCEDEQPWTTKYIYLSFKHKNTFILRIYKKVKKNMQQEELIKIAMIRYFMLSEQTCFIEWTCTTHDIHESMNEKQDNVWWKIKFLYQSTEWPARIEWWTAVNRGEEKGTNITINNWCVWWWCKEVV